MPNTSVSTPNTSVKQDCPFPSLQRQNSKVGPITEFSALCDYLRSLEKSGVVAIEGFTGSGKSYLADALSSTLGLPVIHTDEFLVGEEESLLYSQRLDYDRLRSALDNNIKRDDVTLFDGICARESLRNLNIRASHFIYVKRIGENGLWYDGFQLEDFEADPAISENNEEPYLSDFKYHIAEQPHKNASVVFERVEK